ncbi:MAG TPA: right-handed parallel beta-helix repeat-containing protein [Terriglobales bacterium]|nr:right-handed parallel beta-helix repeat-containing protein [Terriglobales bacterium]
MTCYRLACAALLLLIGRVTGFAISSPAATRTYYISATSGNDSNDGMSPEKAWQHLSKIYLKSFSKDAFQPGDTIRLKRGDQWDGQVRIQGNGTAEKPITLGAYGEGPKPLIYGDNQGARWEPVSGHNGIYTIGMGEGSILGPIFMDGKALKTIYPVGSLNRNEGMEAFLARLQPGTLAGQFGGRLWVRMIDKERPNETIRTFRAAGISVANSSYVQIENLDIRRSYVGIDISNSQHVFVHHNDIQDVLGIGIYLRSGDVDCRVESNTVFRSGNTALYVLKGSSNTFRDNWVSHVDTNILGIRVSGDGMGVGLQESQKNLVEYNYFAHSGGMDFYYEEGSTVRYNYLSDVRSAGAPHGVNLSVYGNIYNFGGPTGKPGSRGVNAVATGPGTISVFNNTIFNASGFLLMGSSNKGGEIIFSDNIAFSAMPGTAMTAFGANVASNHNCFWTPGQPVFRYNNASFSSLETYQAGSGLDRDSIFSNPQLLSSTPVTPLDFRIDPSSACNAAAVNTLPSDPAGGRTYDHDQIAMGEPVIGALQVRKPTNRAASTQTCNSHCDRHPFAVASGVYLVRLKFASSVLSGKNREFSLFLNGRKVTAVFEPSETGGPDDILLRYFLVRPGGASIALEPDTTDDTSVVTEVAITLFDTAHGDGPQVVPW